MICLDTNVVVASITGRITVVRERITRALAERTDIGLPAAVLFELWYGVKKSARQEANAQSLQTFLSLGIAEWPFDSEDAREAADIRAVLHRAGTPIGPYDLLIAAQARRRRAKLITANQREFSRVQGLVSEDWTQP